MAEMVKCPLCGKEIGKYIRESVTGRLLGPIVYYTKKMDYRKSSKVFWDGRVVANYLCKACARTKFPEGQYYQVAFYSHGKKTYTCGENGDKFYTRAKADEVAENQMRKIGKPYWVESFKVY